MLMVNSDTTIQEPRKLSLVARGFIILGHALVGWMVCAALIGIGRQLMTMKVTLIVHAVGAPLCFALISWIYCRKFGFTSPLNTALLFLAIVIGLDFFVVALLIEKSFAMFTSPLGTWLPFSLIFCASYLAGEFARCEQDHR